MKKKLLVLSLMTAFLLSSLSACGNNTVQEEKKGDNTLTVLNYGKYIDEDVLKQFEKETTCTKLDDCFFTLLFVCLR